MPSRKHNPLQDAKQNGLQEADSTIRRLEQQLAGEKERRKVLERALDEANDRIEQLAKTKFSIKKARQVLKKGSYLRTILTDTHGSHMEPAAVNAFLNDIETLQPKENLHLGDALDCGGFLAAHHCLGYVSGLDEEGYEKDITAANWLLDEIARRVPQMEQHQLCGNHEVRVERWAVTQSLKNGADAKYLLRLHGAASVLHLQKRGIHWWTADGFHMGLSTRGAIKLGSCYFTHGTGPGGKNTGKSATANQVREFGGNVVHGHTHRANEVFTRSVKGGSIVGACPGCLCKLQPLYHHGSINEWTHGYAVQLVMPDGDFLHINVPIIDGVSYLRPLVERFI